MAVNVMERKNLTLQVKEIDESQGIIRGYLSVFNNVDYQNDRVLPGAFKKTIGDAIQRKTNKQKKYLWPLLWMHEPEKPIGGFIDAVEDAKGLYVTAQLDISTNANGVPNNPLATMVFSGYKCGYVDELSIGYKAIQKEYTGGIRDIKEAQLWEGSAVTSMFAANNEALVNDVKTNKPASQETKDFNDRYRQECIQDWMYSDFSNLMLALKQSCMDIFSIGDTPQTDVISTILDDGNGAGFISALEAWVQKGIDLDVSNYMNSGNNASQYGYMRNSLEMDTKDGRAISAANADKIQTHMKTLNDMASQHKAMMEQTKAVAADLGALLGTPENPSGEKSITTEPLETLSTTEPEIKTTSELEDLEAFLAEQLKHLNQ